MSENPASTMGTGYSKYYEPLDAMYPDIYHEIYPYVKQACEMYDTPNNPGFNPYPTRNAVNQMTDYVYQRVAPQVGYQMEMERQYFGRDLLRPLIAILIIRELLRRRGPHYYY